MDILIPNLTNGEGSMKLSCGFSIMLNIPHISSFVITSLHKSDVNKRDFSRHKTSRHHKVLYLYVMYLPVP